MLKLRNWIDINKIEWSTLSLNPNAIELLKENPHKIDWDNLSENENAIEILKDNLDKIDWVPFLTDFNGCDLSKAKFQKSFLHEVWS